MLRGCLLALAMYAAICVGYFFWLDTVFDRPASYYGSAALGLVVFLSLGALLNARNAWRDWSLGNAARHAFPPREGRLFAACGPIYPVDQPILAPFSGTPCCLCEYDLSTTEPVPGSQEKTGSDLAGFLLTPSEVQTSTGNVRVLGFPVLEEGESHRLSSYSAARRARDFVSNTQFEDISGLRLLNAFAAIEDAWTDDDGSVNKNLQLKKVDPKSLFPDDLEAAYQEFVSQDNTPADSTSPIQMPDDLDEDHAELEDEKLDNEDLNEEDLDDEEASFSSIKLPTMKENRVEPGEQVCVIGRYDEMRRGILPVGSGMKAIRLIRGDVDTFERKSRASLWSHLIGGTLFLIGAHVVTWFLMFMYLNSESQLRKFGDDALKAAEHGDLLKLQAMEKRGTLHIDAIDKHNQRTLLMEAKDAATAQWLIERKVPLNLVDREGNTALNLAARQGKDEIVRLLIDAKADVNLGNHSGETPLAAADRYGHATAAEMLRSAGANDSVITAQNGEPLPDDGGPQLDVIRKYIAALQARQGPLLYSLMTTPSDVEITDEMWSNYQLSAPKLVERFEGFTRGDDATVVVFGPWGDGNSPSQATFQLRRLNGQWRVADSEIEVN
jgi:hypothetical protein